MLLQPAMNGVVPGSVYGLIALVPFKKELMVKGK